MKNFTSEELCVLIFLSRVAAGRTEPFVRLLRDNHSPVEILEKAVSGFFPGMEAEVQCLRKNFYPEQELERCLKAGVSIIGFNDPLYPAMLREIYDPPIVLYVKGTLLPCDSAAVAIVGSRHASVYGAQQARRFARELAQSGFTIVSGLARGIDLAAHQGALEVPSGRTIAVLGCGVDVFYPKENSEFYSRIAERGAVVSEYALGSEPCAHHFPKRNRIISGFSLGVLVVEAHVRSGSLITARLALEQGREVFAMPGRIDQVTSRGTHQLLREGAFLADSTEVLVEAMAPEGKRLLKASMQVENEGGFTANAGIVPFVPPHPKPEPNPLENLNAETARLVSLLQESSLTPDELQQRSALTGDDFFSALLWLELTKTVKKLPNGMLELNVR